MYSPYSFNGHINKENKEYYNLYSPFFVVVVVVVVVVVEMTENTYIIYRAVIPTVLYTCSFAPPGKIY